MEKFKMNEIKIAAAEEFEVLEDALAPSWGIVCKGGTFGIFCN